jgi:hypothetical protein
MGSWGALPGEAPKSSAGNPRQKATNIAFIRGQHRTSCGGDATRGNETMNGLWVAELPPELNKLHELHELHGLHRVKGICAICHGAFRNWLPLLVTLQLIPFQRQACRLPHSAAKMVAREGAAPPISGCRPDVILFHHRALQWQNFAGLLGCGDGLMSPRAGRETFGLASRDNARLRH